MSVEFKKKNLIGGIPFQTGGNGANVLVLGGIFFKLGALFLKIGGIFFKIGGKKVIFGIEKISFFGNYIDPWNIHFLT